MNKILITGATGHLGKAVTEELLQKVPAGNISVLVRDAGKAQHFAEQGIQVITGDYNDYPSLVQAFAEVDKLYFVSGSDVVHRSAQHENVVRAATAAGVGHLIYTSFQRKTEDGSSPIAFVASAHLLTEQLIKASGLTYTLLKHALYTNILPQFMGEHVLETGSIFLPAGQGKTSFATRQDMARAAAVILSSTGHENKTYALAGSQAFSFTEIAAMLTELSGKEIQYLAPSAEAFQAALSKAGVPEEAIQGAATFCQGIAAQEFNFPDDTLEKLIGETVSVRAYLKEAYHL